MKGAHRIFVGLIVAVIATLLVSPGYGAGSNLQEEHVELSKKQVATIALEAEIGRYLYLKDAASAHATDLLFQKVPDPGKEHVRGWITLETPNSNEWLVRFFRANADGSDAAAIYDVHVGGSSESVKHYPDGDPLTGDQALMVAMRQKAMASFKNYCSPSINPTIVPPKTAKGDWRVYLLAATSDPKVVILAGHKLAIFRHNGKLRKTESLSKSCLAQKIRDNSVGLYVTHLISDTPIATHVFASLLYKLPIFVGTPNNIAWRVAGGQITAIGRINTKK